MHGFENQTVDLEFFTPTSKISKDENLYRKAFEATIIHNWKKNVLDSQATRFYFLAIFSVFIFVAYNLISLFIISGYLKNKPSSRNGGKIEEIKMRPMSKSIFLVSLLFGSIFLSCIFGFIYQDVNATFALVVFFNFISLPIYVVGDAILPERRFIFGRSICISVFYSFLMSFITIYLYEFGLPVQNQKKFVLSSLSYILSPPIFHFASRTIEKNWKSNENSYFKYIQKYVEKLKSLFDMKEITTEKRKEIESFFHTFIIYINIIILPLIIILQINSYHLPIVFLNVLATLYSLF